MHGLSSWRPVPTSPVVPTLSQPPEGGWGHEKPCENNSVPNLTSWSQPFAIHSCGRIKKRREHVLLQEKRRTPVGDTEVGATPGQVIELEREKAVATPSWLGPRVPRLGPGRIKRRSPHAAAFLVVFALAEDRRMLHLAVTEAEGPQLVSLHHEHIDPRAGHPPRAGRDSPVLHPRARPRYLDRLGDPRP